MPSPLISIFLPTHARYKSGLLSKAVDSILRQSYSDFELFIIDDASSDGTEQYVEKLAREDRRIIPMRFDTNVGLPAVTLAKAFLRTKGEFLAFAFDDGQWLPDHLETLAAELIRSTEAMMVYGMVRFAEGSSYKDLGAPFDLIKLTNYNYIGNLGVALRRTAIDTVGWYDPHITLKRCCDWDLWLRIGKAELPVIYCQKLLAIESGLNQPDSLGHSVTLCDGLARKYMQRQRDHLLSPAAIAEEAVNIFEPTDWMNTDESRLVRCLAIEHFLRTNQKQKIMQLAKAPTLMTNRHSASDANDTQMLLLLDVMHEYSSTLKSLAAKEIEELHCSKQEFNKLYCEIDAQYHQLLRSSSWQVTKPLRELRSLLVH